MNNNGNNIQIGNLFGIPFFINPSWFVVLGLVTLSYGSDLARFPQLSGFMPWLLGLVAALLLFASVLAHELGHSFAAIAQGIKVKSITLFIFGGLASLEKESETPFQSLLVAIAGPLVSVLLFGVFLLINSTLTLSAPISAIFSLLASINLVLALFNMIPGLPLDGGNVLKAIVWKITGNPNKGIIIAGRVGQFFGYLAVGFGILGILNILPFGSFWTLLIGWFLLQNAVDETRHLLGEVFVDDLKTIPTSDWTQVRLAGIIKPVSEVTKIASNLSLLEVAKLIETQSIKEMVVLRENQEVLGLLEKTSIFALLQQKPENDDIKEAESTTT